MAEPVLKIRDKTLSAAVFEYMAEHGKTYSVCLQKSYKKKGENDWKTQDINVFEDDLLKLANLCIKTYNAIIERQK